MLALHGLHACMLVYQVLRQSSTWLLSYCCFVHSSAMDKHDLSILCMHCSCHRPTKVYLGTLIPQLVLVLLLFCPCSPAAAKRVQSQLCAVIRPMYSSPPMHGAAIVVTVLSDPQLYSQWKRELADMSARIQRMRTALKSALLDVGCPGNWDHITNQIGMFSFTGLNRGQCENMTKKWHMYMTMVRA